MINKDRIVPITKQDLLTMYATMLNLIGLANDSNNVNVLAANSIEGDFSVTGTGNVGGSIANQPVKTLDFASGVTAGSVLFVAAYDYAGITVAGAAATIADGSATVIPDGATLYVAILASGEVTIKAVSPVVSA